jgi:hypothetical protein
MDDRPGSLAQDNKDDRKAYLDWLLDAINQYAGQIRRTTFLALFLIAVFVIVAQSGKQINLKGIDISEGSVVDIFIPALVAYLFLQLVTDTNRLIALYKKFSEHLDAWARKSQLSVSYSLVMPPFPLVWGASMTMRNIDSAPHGEERTFLVKAIDKTAPAVGLIFLIISYIVLLWPYKHLSAVAFVSIAFSIAISLACVIFGVKAYRRTI